MAKDFSRETKFKLCGLYNGNNSHDKLNYLQFVKEVIQTNPQIEDYAPLLFIYGTNEHDKYLLAISDEAQAKFKIQDENYCMWVQLCEQIKFLLEQKSCDFFYSQHDHTKKQMFSLYNQKGLQANILKTLIDDLCQFENDIAGNNQAHPNDITLQLINEKLENTKIEKEKVYGVNRGRPTAISVLPSHFLIQGLSSLLRIDKLIKLADGTKTINDIPLTIEDYEFIYDYLSYFDLLGYEPCNNTTTKADLIEQRFKNPPLKNNPGLKDYISIMHKGINENCKKLALQNNNI